MTLYDLVNALDTNISIKLYIRYQLGARTITMCSDIINSKELKHMCRAVNKVAIIKICTLKVENDIIYVEVNSINE